MQFFIGSKKLCQMRKFCLLIIIILGSGEGFAQVNLPTGGATFSLPIFNWKDTKSRLNTLIELNYNSGNGLKVNDLPSNVGQGWSLISGGVITRIQAGEPDDQKPNPGNGTIEDVTRYPAGYLYDTSSRQGYSNTLTKYPIFPDKNHIYKQHNDVAADKELDHFAFQFNGRSGVFVLGKNSYGSLGPVFLGDTKMKVWFDQDEGMINQGIRTTISVFYIQDENGLIYKFAQHDLTKVLKVKYCNSNLTAKYTQPNFKSGGRYYEEMYDNDPSIVNPYIINSWFLTEIKDTLTKDSISFNYNMRNIDADAGTSITYYSPKNYSIVSHARSVSQTPAISSIIFPDGHKAVFKYGAARIDMKGDSVLASIDIEYQNRYLSKYILNTAYFIRNRYGNPKTDFENKSARLCLLSIQKMGIDLKDEDHPYLFDYYLGSSAGDDFVPPPFFHLKDNWGYYNGDQSKEVNGTSIKTTSSPFNLENVQLKGLCFLRDGVTGTIINTKEGYAKNGLLHQITFPTGSSLNYDYDQNKAIINGQNIFVGGVHVSKTTVTDGGYSNDCNHPIVTNYKYYLDPAYTQSSLWGVETPLNSMTVTNHYSPEKKYFKLFSLSCKYHFQYPGILSRDNTVALTTGQQILAILSKVAGFAGTVSEVIDIIQFAAGATGPAAIIIDAIATIVNAVVSCFISQTSDNSMTIYYNSDLHASNPLPSQFKRVEVSENSGSTGKTVYEFTSSDDYPFWDAVNPTFSMKQRYAYWTYGLPKRTTIYDNAGHPIRQTENFYDTAFSREYLFCHSCYTAYTSYKALVVKNSSQNSKDWDNNSLYKNVDYTSDLTSNPDMKVDGYDAITGRYLLDSTIEREFKKGDPNQYMATSTEFSYNNNLYPTINYEVNQIKTTQSNGDILYKTIRYDNGLLNDNNIVTTPFETTNSFIKKNETTRYYTGESVTEYTSLINGNIVPSKTLVQRFNAPVAESSMSFYAYPNSPSNPAYKETQTFSYDNNSNLTGIKDEGNHSVANIYDYNDKYVVASVINAVAGLDKAAYTSFETTDFSRSGWTMNGIAVYSISSAITGTNSLTLSSGKSLTSSLNTAKPYTLSFWASNSMTVTGNATLTKSAPSINGFTYYEYKIAQGTATVAVSGSGNIDELRLYPQNARMRTVTYDPLIGKTSECDENNRVTYYEYDALGRMRFIKDENRNVVKMYEYNIKSKNNGCATTYHNLAVSEVFSRNNCSAGYMGTDTTYTIPDSKYISTISQADVDQKVQAELDAMGQSFANTNALCKLLYYNDALTQTFTKEGCAAGYKGTSVTYTVPANKYSTTVSKDSANALAQEDMDANAQSFANLPGSASCVIDNAADYEGEEDAPRQCQQSNGANTGHQLILVTDVNPNSSTYNQTQWADMGVNTSSCPVTTCTNCTGAAYKCINGNCELGQKVYTDSQCVPAGGLQPNSNSVNMSTSNLVYPNYNGQCQMTYHYEWSDGSWSQNYTESGGGCAVGGTGCLFIQ